MTDFVIITFAVLAIWGVCGYSAAILAEYKGYDRWTGIKAAVLLGLPGLLILAILPKRDRLSSVLAVPSKIWADCPHCGELRQFYEGFCTVCGTRIVDAVPGKTKLNEVPNSDADQSR